MIPTAINPNAVKTNPSNLETRQNREGRAVVTRTNQEMRNRPDMTAAAEGEPNRTEKIRGANAAGRMTPRIRRPVVVQGKG